MNELAIYIRNLLISYDDFKLWIENLELESGYIYGLIGKNGAGKTTLLKSIIDLITHTNDQILIYGKELKKHEIELKNKIGYVNDEFIYPLDMNPDKVAKNIGCFYEHFDREYFDDLLEKFKISKFSKFKEMSKGDKNKFMIIFVLSYSPNLLILDEPTANIDPVNRREILDLLFDFMNENRTILFSTHITSDLDRIADDVLLLEQGNVVFNLPKDQMEEKYQKVYMDTVPQDIQPFLKGLVHTELGYEALCTNAKKFEQDPRFTFKRANIEEIMYYWEIHHE